MTEIDAAMFTKLVAHAIPAAPDEPRTAISIADELGATKSRVERAVARIKEDRPDLPITSSAAGYLWSRNNEDVQKHAQKEVRYVATRTRRSLLEGLLEPYGRHCDSEQITKARQRIEFILDDLAQVTA